MNLREAAQQALKALEWNYNTDLDNIPACEQWAKMLNETITALKQALAEPDSDYERGFVDGMNLQTKGSVDKAVNRMAQTTHWEGCEAVHPECRKPEQEPVAWVVYDTDNNDIAWSETGKRLKAETPLYTAPTPRKPLTDEEIVDIWADVSIDYDDQINIIEMARAIERAHGIGGEA